MIADPHANTPLLRSGSDLSKARGVIVLIHGRGASAQDILELFPMLDAPDFAAIAPQASGYSWWPNSFLAPLESNQPFVDSALQRIESIVSDLLKHIPSDRIALLGFSQGACLACEFVAQHPRRYGAVMALTGGLIGPPGTARNYSGSLEKTPVFLGSGDPDPHVPFERVIETRDVLARMGGEAELRRYRNRPHTIEQDEIDACRDLLARIGKGNQ